LREQIANWRHQFDRTNKAIDDVIWYHKVGDVAHVDKVRMTGPAKWKEKNPTAQGAGNPVRFVTAFARKTKFFILLHANFV
jgi:hypothetical protein